MKSYPAQMDVVDFARQIIDLDRRNRALEAEVERLANYEKKYDDLIMSSISHSSKVMSGILEIVATPGVMDAIGKAKS